MKNFIKVFVFTILVCTSCNDAPNPKSNAISVFIDRTEVDAYVPSGKDLFDKLPNHQLSDGLELSIIVIGDTHYATPLRFVLKQGETGLLGNDDERRKHYRFLRKKVTDSLQKLKGSPYSYKRSDIFRSVVKELEYMANNKSSHRELWLFSDLKEHSFFSVYDKNQLHKLINTPKVIAKIFEEQIDVLSDLNDITLRICHKPTLEDIDTFSAMVQLYKTILEPKGVNVKVGLDHQILIN